MSSETSRSSQLLTGKLSRASVHQLQQSQHVVVADIYLQLTLHEKYKPHAPLWLVHVVPVYDYDCLDFALSFYPSPNHSALDVPASGSFCQHGRNRRVYLHELVLHIAGKLPTTDALSRWSGAYGLGRTS